MRYELIVIGGGPAGLAAAISTHKNGLKRIAVIERDREAGGILNQCIHNGFGLHRFKEELSGPEYAGRFIDMLRDTEIELLTDTMVLSITPGKKVVCVSPAKGYNVYEADSIILAMGCRERTRGAIGIPGDRPSGVFTAGTAQRYLNLEGYMCGQRAVILGSGDIGLIMARRLTLEGAKVLACVEVMPYSGGLSRNIAQCLNDFGIPLYLSHTVTDVRAQNGRLCGVTVCAVDEKRHPIKGTEMDFECDTLLLSVGLIPENELTREAGIEIDPRTNGARVYENMETSLPGVFACGNVCHVHDLVDYVSDESERAGKAAAEYVKHGEASGAALEIKAGSGVTYTVPQHIRPGNVEKSADVFFRVNRIMQKSAIVLCSGGAELARFRREHMAPGEMEHIMLPAALLKNAQGEITVSTEEAQA
ncbi:MAG: FAD-dependent oxidoreductase [Clostridia bacterium]|nr:FAD-dependent oxidoreductase [Clostridia bacterium]